MRLPLIFSLVLTLSTSTVGANSDQASIAMAEEQVDYQLQPIVVTATRTPHTLWESDANVDVLTSADIEQSSAQHLGDVLKLLPGVSVATYGSMGQNASLSLRGSTSGQVLIMIDGVPINDIQLGGFDLNLIPLEDVQSIEVVRGAVSSLYGADALGGVVNIITRSTIYERPLTHIKYQKGAGDLEKIAARFARLFGQRFGLNLMGSSIKSAGFRDNSDFEGRHMTGKLSCSLGEKGLITYRTHLYDADLGVPGMDLMPTPNARQEDQNWNQAITLQFCRGLENSLRSIIYRNYSRQAYKNPDFFTEAKHRRWIYGIELQNSFSFGSAHKMTVGGEIQNRRLDSSENGCHDLYRGAMFLQEELTLRSNVKFRLAGRYDYHEKFDDQFCPDLTITWLAGNHASLFTSFRRSYRTPTFNDLYWPQSNIDYDLDGKLDYGESGNVDVKPEKAMAFQIGGRIQAGPFTGNGCFFRREVSDLIQWDNVDESYVYGCWMPVNKSQATIKGFEGQVTLKHLDRLQSSLTYAFLDAKDDLLDKRLPYQPQHKIAGYVQYGMNLIQNELDVTARLGIEYIGARYADASEEQELNSNFVYNGKVTARILSNFQIYLFAENLGDEKYFLRSGYPLPGRAFYGGLSWEFWD
jgi:outer membrane receptor for ferrienterochelin and colicins